MTRVGSMLVVAVAAAGAGCMAHSSRGAAQSQPAQAQGAPQAGGARAGMMQLCPMAVPGTQVAAADTDDGEAITFTTTSPDAVQDLRARVHAMADMHNRHMEEHAGMQGMPGGMGDAGPTGEDGATGPEGSAGSGDGAPQPGEAQGGGMQGGQGMQGMQGMHHMMPPSRATVEDVDGGARVTVTAERPDDADQLRTAIRSHVDRMQQTGSCGMEHGMPEQRMQRPSQQQ